MRRAQPEDYERDAILELFDIWRSSAEYEQWHADEEADQWSGWEGERTFLIMRRKCRTCTGAAMIGEPEDPGDPYDDPYGGADLSYDGVDA